MKSCPCTSGRAYADCCRPLHEGRPAPTPLALMRARFAAHALGRTGFVVRTTHPDNRPSDLAAWRRELRAYCRETTFAGLQILAEEAVDERNAAVTFRALLVRRGRDASFVERSLFAWEKGHWFYRRPDDSLPPSAPD